MIPWRQDPAAAPGSCDPAAEVPELLSLAEDSGAAPIVRATALELVGFAADPAAADRATALLDDPDPLVRAAAAGALSGLPPEQRLDRLQPALRDPMRNVRIAAAKALLDAQVAPSGADAAALSGAMDEYRASLMTRTDFPETHLQIGGAGLTMRNWQLALNAFGEAVSLDPQLVDGWSMIVRINAALGQTDAARTALDEALKANPDNPALTALQGQIGAP